MELFYLSIIFKATSFNKYMIENLCTELVNFVHRFLKYSDVN